MKTSEALLYARTIRHLRPVQLFGRARRALVTPSVDRRPAPPLRPGDALAAPAHRAPVLVGPTTVEMLGERGRLATAADWAEPLRSALWRYHCHYFDDLRAAGRGDRAPWNDALIERWIDEHPPGSSPGWDPYPTSLRIVNWVRWGREHGLSERALDSLASQARHVRANLEWHILGNHLLANAKALVFAGAYFDGKEADAWRVKGLSLLAREANEQILDDGGHFERSPMYHALVLEDVLDLLALVQATPEAFPSPPATERWLGDIADRMGDWIAAVVHPDGELSLFNDAAIGQAPSPAALEDYAARLGRTGWRRPGAGATVLGPSGYVRIEVGRAIALLDVGEIGPGYLPGHAHADTLSFELSVDDARVVVNGGTSTYEPGDERLRQRGTAAHSTVEVDGENSSEVWSSFRVARRARPLDLAIEETSGIVRVSCAHDGYQRLPGRVTHHRSWTFDGGGLDLEDTLTGRFQSAVGRLHLHPDIALHHHGPAFVLERRGSAPLEVSPHGATLESEAGRWTPAFGYTRPNSHIRHVPDGGAHTIRIRLSW